MMQTLVGAPAKFLDKLAINEKFAALTDIGGFDFPGSKGGRQAGGGETGRSNELTAIHEGEGRARTRRCTMVRLVHLIWRGAR